MFPNALFPPRAAMKSKILKIHRCAFQLALVFCRSVDPTPRDADGPICKNILYELNAIPEKRLCLAAIFTLSSYTIMAGYDYLAIRFIKHSLSLVRIGLASFIGYAFSNNIGFSMLAGASVRYRPLFQLGLSALEITKVVAFCTLTLWLGFLYARGLGLRSGANEDSTRVAYPFSHYSTAWRSVSGCTDGLFCFDRLPSAACAFQGMGNRAPIFANPSFSDLVACLDWLLAATVLYTLAAVRVVSVFPKSSVYISSRKWRVWPSQIPGGWVFLKPPC